jgi:hypothetical protein
MGGWNGRRRQEERKCKTVNKRETEKMKNKLRQSQIKLSLCLTKHHAMKTYCGVEI